MKTCFRILLSAIAVSLMFLASTGCEPSDTDKDYGFPVVYMPQSTITGLDNSYPIPNGAFGQNTSYSCNFKDGKLNIVLGVTRAGYFSVQKPFSVDLKESQALTDKKLAEYAASNTPAMVLPSGVYSIPSKIEVAAGTNWNTCYMTIDLNALAAQKASIIEGDKYKLLVLGIELANLSEPTYQLSEDNASVVLILDLNSSYWDSADASLPESQVRSLFPLMQ